MAGADYAHCEVCDAKVFYDAEVVYDVPSFGEQMALCVTCAETNRLTVTAKEASDG